MVAGQQALMLGRNAINSIAAAKAVAHGESLLPCHVVWSGLCSTSTSTNDADASPLWHTPHC
jgi:hypothetical protein